MSTNSIKTLQTFDTIYAADSVEWCRTNEHKNFFVCGTYELDKENEASLSYNRKGKLYLFNFSIDTESFTVSDIYETSAILDIKWLKNFPIFGICNSTGEIEIFQIENEKLINKIKIKLNNDENGENLALSLDWNKENDKLVSSDSKGFVTVFDYNNSGLTKIKSWLAHGFEAWTCAFDQLHNNIIYSGGDDTFLNVYDIRTAEESAQLTLKNKSHTAGVTSLLNSDESKIITGSYDEILRVFDIRKLRQPLHELNLCGGIWRIKLNPHNHKQLICACMYHNFSIVKYESNLELIAEYFEHTSICYGTDWSYIKHKNNNYYYFTTCSMYDHKLNLSCFEN